MQVVSAPSELKRPAGGRAEADTWNALHLARLLHLGEFTSVTVPSVEQKVARQFISSIGASELLNARYRRAVRGRGHFLDEPSALK